MSQKDDALDAAVTPGRAALAMLRAGALLLTAVLTVAPAMSAEPAAEPANRDEAAAATPGLGNYEIGVGDRLRIHVWEDPDLKPGQILSVAPDGFISFPLVGDVRVEGRTRAEVRQEIADRISVYIPDPTVVVILDQVNSLRFYVIGEVNQQGVFEVQSRVRVLQLLAMAGGPTPFAKKDQIVLVRNRDGVEVRRTLEYKKILAGDPDHDVWMMPGDTLIVF